MTDTIETDTERRRTTTVHCRFQVLCQCCGLVECLPRKREAIARMIGHMSQHALSETLTFEVYDLMSKRAGTKTIYGGRIHNGTRSHGIGVAV